MQRRERRQPWRKPERRKRAVRGRYEAGSRPPSLVPDRLAGIGKFRQRVLHRAQQRLPSGRGRGAAVAGPVARAGQQRCMQLLLQLPDLVADGAGGDVQLRRGPHEAALAGHGGEGPKGRQGGKGHHRHAI